MKLVLLGIALASSLYAFAHSGSGLAVSYSERAGLAEAADISAVARAQAFDNAIEQATVKDTTGAKIYVERCALCHGSKGLGEGPLPLLVRDYPSTNLRKLLTEHTPEAITEAIVEGGSGEKGNRLSPPWKHEISETDIELVSRFVNMLRVDYAAAVEEIRTVDVQASNSDGRKLYLARCQRCHGRTGQGDGPLNALLGDAPATNLTASVLSAEARMAIIRRGGAALGRSPQMPPWDQELTGSELKSLVGYLGTLTQKDIALRLD